MGEKPRYPLSGLVASRAVDRQSAELELAAQRALLSERDAQLVAAQTGLAAARDERRAQLRLEAGARTGAELAREGARAAQHATNVSALERELARVMAARSQQARALRLAELTWQAACVEHTLVDRHHERFLAAERKTTQRTEQDETEDVHATLRALRRER